MQANEQLINKLNDGIMQTGLDFRFNSLIEEKSLSIGARLVDCWLLLNKENTDPLVICNKLGLSEYELDRYFVELLLYKQQMEGTK